MKNIRKLLDFFILGILKALPQGETADGSSLFGLIGLQANANAYATGAIQPITTAGTNSNLTAAQAVASVIKLNSGASGGFTITLPTTSAILAALPSTIPTDGTFSKIIHIENNSVGQTGTLTAGDASTTITGTATIATAVVREYLFTVLTATTVSYENIGSKTL